MEAQVLPLTDPFRRDTVLSVAKVGVVGEYPRDVRKRSRRSPATIKSSRSCSRQGSKIEVHAVLEPNPKVPSGYSWSTSSGPPFQVEGGTRVTIAVVVARKPPSATCLPIFGEARACLICRNRYRRLTRRPRRSRRASRDRRTRRS